MEQKGASPLPICSSGFHRKPYVKIRFEDLKQGKNKPRERVKKRKSRLFDLFSSVSIHSNNSEAEREESPIANAVEEDFTDLGSVESFQDGLVSMNVVSSSPIQESVLPTCGYSNCASQISPATVVELLTTQKYSSSISEFIIIDCRYDYEFEGGHIKGALNLSRKALIKKFYERARMSIQASVDNPKYKGKRRAVIFHCEFSQHRGPELARFFRSLDRQANAHRYPHLDVEEVHVMKGGYKAFFNNPEYRKHCRPCGYVQMLDEKFKDLCLQRKNHHSFRDQARKRERAKRGSRRSLSSTNALFEDEPSPSSPARSAGPNTDGSNSSLQLPISQTFDLKSMSSTLEDHNHSNHLHHLHHLHPQKWRKNKRRASFSPGCRRSTNFGFPTSSTSCRAPFSHSAHVTPRNRNRSMSLGGLGGLGGLRGLGGLGGSRSAAVTPRASTNVRDAKELLRQRANSMTNGPAVMSHLESPVALAPAPHYHSVLTSSFNDSNVCTRTNSPTSSPVSPTRMITPLESGTTVKIWPPVLPLDTNR